MTDSAALQRFVGQEHKDLGDTTGRMIDLGNGVLLTWGDLIALAGDEYKNLEDLLADTKDDAGKQRLLAAFRDDHIPDPTATQLPEPTEEQKSARFLEFLKLAAENPEHFNADGGAIERWKRDHTTAIAVALDAGLTKDESARQIALAREAFAQHFLTDSFSGGHIRTPRAEIIAWYRVHFGPAVVEGFISRISNRLIDGIVRQISPQTNWPDAAVRYKVRKEVGQRLATAIARLDGGRAAVNDYIALGIAGIVSGAMHDLEGDRGVQVASEAHPEPWTAFGDAKLSASPVSKAQAELAITAATAHIDAAYEIGRRHGAAGDVAHAPTVTYFGFNSTELAPSTSTNIVAAVRYLDAHPEAQITLTGHTDPTGPDSYNDALGLRRAQAVATRLKDAGIPAEQVLVLSQGERALVTAAPSQFRLNRRVSFTYASRPGPYRDRGRDDALAETRNKLPAPYRDVTRFVPRPLPETNSTPATGQSTPATAQVKLEDWRWGSIPPTLRSAVNTWVRGYGPILSQKIATLKELDDTTVDDYTIRPRPLVAGIVNDLLTDPAAFLETVLGRPMSP
jgi:outer membrane protein OmpA-like peptidoglycan-associated protein